jgi:uncharacterized protein
MKIIRLLFLFFILPFATFSQQFPERPEPPRLVNDFTKTLSAEEVNLLEQKLVAYNDSTSTQVAIVMISSLDGYPVDDYAIQLGEKWGIGQKGKDNGVLIFVAKDDRKIFIPTGYGMEGVMPDGLVKRIIETDMKPYFKENKFYEGFDQATESIFRLAAGEYTADEKPLNPVPGILTVLGIIFIIILVFVIQVRSVKNYASVNGINCLMQPNEFTEEVGAVFQVVVEVAGAVAVVEVLADLVEEVLAVVVPAGVGNY